MRQILSGRYDRQICVAALYAKFFHCVDYLRVIFSAKFLTAPLNEKKNHNGISQIPFLWQDISNQLN